MKQQTITATLGALLHDIGKLAHRAGESGTHSASGVRVLRERVPDREILDCVAYHHESALRHARLAADSPAYIVNLADSISAAADRREEEGEEGSASRFDRYCALESIFNHLLNHHAEGRLRARGLDGALRFPEAGLRNEAADYKTILRELLEGIGALRMEAEWIPSLLALLEAWTSSVPSSTARDERADISLFDHAKIAAAVAACGLFSHVQKRVAVWRNPWSDISGSGYQIAQSLFAVGTGGWFGMGLYQGMPKSIPVVEKDFMFAAISEELGGIFALCVIFICLGCFLQFMLIANKMQAMFYKMIAFGLGVVYITQVFLTIGGVVKFIPSTGVTLPFVSYGGSSILSTFIIFGVIQGLYILKRNEEEEDEAA